MRNLNFKIPTEIVELVEVIGKRRIVKSNEILRRVGEKRPCVFFIKNGGFLCQLIDDETGIERNVNFYLDSFQAFMSTIDNYFVNVKSDYQLKAFRKSEIFELSKETIDYYINSNNNVHTFCRDLIVNTLLIESDFKSKLICLDAEGLYKYLISSYPELIINVPSKYIAEFMRISPQWLSKIKRRI